MDYKTRKNKTVYIIDNIANITDSQLTKLYDKVIDVTHKDTCDDFDRVQMLEFIEKNLRYVNDECLLIIDDMVANFIICEESDEEKKYRIVLEVINKILEVLKIKRINELCEFDHVERKLLLCEDCKRVVNENLKYILENGFSKHGCMLYSKNIKDPHLSVIKGMLKQIGYKLQPNRRSKMKNRERIIYIDYSIVKN